MRPAMGRKRSKDQDRPGFVALQEAPIFPFHCFCWCEGGEKNARPARRGAMPPTLMMGQILGQEKCGVLWASSWGKLCYGRVWTPMVSLLWGLWLACSLIGPAHLSTAASQGFWVSATERGSDSCTAVLVLPVMVAASAVLHVCTTDQKPKTHTKKGTETCPNGRKVKFAFSVSHWEETQG